MLFCVAAHNGCGATFRQHPCCTIMVFPEGNRGPAIFHAALLSGWTPSRPHLGPEGSRKTRGVPVRCWSPGVVGSRWKSHKPPRPAGMDPPPAVLPRGETAVGTCASFLILYLHLHNISRPLQQGSDLRVGAVDLESSRRLPPCGPRLLSWHSGPALNLSWLVSFL